MAAQAATGAVREEGERARRRAAYRMGPVYEELDDGSRVLINDRIELSYVEQKEWDARAAAARDQELPSARHAAQELSEEVSVLRMVSPSLAVPALLVRDATDKIVASVAAEEDVTDLLSFLDASVQNLWSMANGDW